MNSSFFDKRFPVSKMHGLGNDFVVYADFEERTTPDIVRELCDRHMGIGADGAISVVKSRIPQAKYRMKYFNSDGSLVEMCGNGIRCFAKYLYDNKLIAKKGKISVDTDAGIIIPEILSNNAREAMIKVNMGVPVFYNPKQVALKRGANGLVQILFPIKDVKDGKLEKLKGTFVSMGNPHVVFFVEKGRAEKLTKKYGPQIEVLTEIFPQKTNVEFVEINSKKGLTVHVWERGCGYTLACGTGACAVLAASVANKLTDKSAKIQLPGGLLEIDWEGNGRPIFMTGPARNVCKIVF